jgi:hypothetical protein
MEFHMKSATSMPMGLLRKMRQAQEGAAWESHKEFHDGLRRAGLKLNMGEDGSGHLFGRGGGKSALQ